MSSLEHLLCSDSIDKRPRSSLEYVQYSNHQDASSSDSSVKPNSRRCSVPDCKKTAKRGGRCISHRGGNKCAVDGCTTSVISRGLCVAHGGGKRCQTSGCTKSAQSGGFCWVHGGGKKCGFHGCSKRAQSGGACIAHGGGKRCRIDGCNKVVQYDGLCVGHGGYRRCVFKNCDKRAMANDHCQQHGGSSVCLLERCYKRAVRGGMCSAHKTGASLQSVNVSRLSIPSQSSDEDRDQQKSKHKPEEQTRIHRVPPTPEWRSRLDLKSLMTKSSSYLRAPTPCSQMNDTARRSPPPVTNVILNPDKVQREDSPIAPGLSALLNADDKFPSFPTYAKKFDSRERYVRRQHQSQHQEQKVYPLLPSIQALQNYRNSEVSIPKPQLNSTAATVPLKSQLRIVVREDPDRLKRSPSPLTDCHEGEEGSDAGFEVPSSSKHYVQSYYYRKNSGAYSVLHHSTNSSACLGQTSHLS